MTNNQTTPASGDARLALASLFGTFIFFRVFLFFFPETDLTILGYPVHHLFSGVVLMVVSAILLILSRPGPIARRISLVTFFSGSSLSLDQVVYLIVTDGSNASYNTPASFLGGLILVCLAAAGIFLVSRSHA